MSNDILKECAEWLEQHEISMVFGRPFIWNPLQCNDLKWRVIKAISDSVASAVPSGELPPLPEPLEIYWPELHSQALGCGVEDRNIHDRYEAAEYGWQDGVDKSIERVPDAIYDADQMRAYAAAAIAAQQAAPAARLTDEQIATIHDATPQTGNWVNDFARSIEAAAAPNAALTEALQQVMRPYGIYDVAVSKAGGLQDDFMAVGEQIRAALASPPVPPKEADNG